MAEPKEFNWEAFETKGFGSGYNKSEIAEMEKMYEATLSEVEEKQVLSGVVVGITDKDVIINATQLATVFNLQHAINSCSELQKCLLNRCVLYGIQPNGAHCRMKRNDE